MTLSRVRSSGVGPFLLGWLLVSLLTGAFGLLGRAPIPPPAIALLLAAGLLTFIWRSPTARAEIRALGLRALVAFHLVRLLAGAYFLILHGRGVLPGEFAIPAGWGDIIVALAALPVLIWCFPIRTGRQLAVLLIWNTAGMLDILGVLARGALILLGDPVALGAFATLPLALLPTFVVPLVLATHVLLWAMARREEGRAARRVADGTHAASPAGASPGDPHLTKSRAMKP